MKKNILLSLVLVIAMSLSAQQEQKPSFVKASPKGMERASSPKVSDGGKPSFQKTNPEHKQRMTEKHSSNSDVKTFTKAADK